VTPAEVIDAFARAWTIGNDAERLALLTTACVPEAVFVASRVEICGVEALSANIAALRCAFPSLTISFGGPDASGGFARVAWAMYLDNEQPPRTGEDFAQFADDGRIRVLVSFDGEAAPGS
jgi:hypothetical protein